MPLVSLTVKPKVPHLSPSSGEPAAHSFFKVAVIAAFPLNGNETRQLSVFPSRILQDSLSLREAGCRKGQLMVSRTCQLPSVTPGTRAGTSGESFHPLKCGSFWLVEMHVYYKREFVQRHGAHPSFPPLPLQCHSSPRCKGEGCWRSPRLSQSPSMDLQEGVCSSEQTHSRVWADI